MDALQESAAPEEALALFEAGELFKNLKWPRADQAETPLLLSVIDLHNAGRIDLLTLPARPEFGALEGRQIFVVQDFLNRAIPRLTGTVRAMMTFVEALVAKAGQDMMAGVANGGFISWCQAQPSRAQEVVAMARSGDGQASCFAYLALQALADPADARDFVAAFDDERRDGALLALGAIPHPTEDARQTTMTALRKVIDGAPGDTTRARVIEACIRIHGATAAPLPTPAVALISDALTGGGDITLHAAAGQLFDLAIGQSALLSPDLIASLLDALKRVNSDNGGTIDLLDVALSSLIEAGFADEAVAFVTALLPLAHGRIPLSRLEGFRDALWKRPAADFNGTVAAWWLSGDHSLSEGLEVAFRRARPPQVLDMDLAPLGLTDGQTESLCRKAIGYGFLQPVTASSVLVSALRTAGPALSKIVEDLLYDPLLTSYGGDLTDYLKSIPVTDPAYAAVRRALRRKTKYLKGLSDAGTIKELHPPESHRQAELTRWQDEMRIAAENARKQSPLLSIIPRSVLLYGRQSLTMVQDLGGGPPRPLETMLHTHGVSMEMPRLQLLDPLGLDQMLLALRSEPVQS